MSEGLAEIRRKVLSGEWPKGCEACRRKEDLGIQSTRTRFQDSFGDYLEQQGIDFTSSEQKVFQIKIGFSNVCNLTCRMCSSEFSTAWFKDDKTLLDEEFDGRRIDPKWFKQTEPALQQTTDILKSAGSPLKLMIEGGEPFLSKMFHQFLREMNSLGLSKNTNLYITTNGSIDPGKYLDDLKQFSTVKVLLSIEGTEKVNAYARSGPDTYTLDAVARNMDLLSQLPNFSRVVVSPTIQIYSLFDIGELIKWSRNRGYLITLQQILVGPPFLNINILPNDIKEMADKYLSNILADFPEEDDLSWEIQCIQKALWKPLDEDQRLKRLGELKAYTRILEAKRGDRIESIGQPIADFIRGL